MVTPCVLQAKHKTYLFSCDGPMKSPRCCFQSFDPIKNCFCTLPTPSLDPSNRRYCVRAYFLVYDHIYLFINGGANSKLHAFSFDTRSSKWKEIESLLSEFEERKIPIPHDHIGNIGLSSKFNDNTQILVTLDHGRPTAYRVRIGAAGSSLHPKSYRRLLEYNWTWRSNTSHLLDIGNQRFCVIFSREEKPLLVYAFKMDFAVEYENQGKSTSLAKPSIEILCSKKFMCSVCYCVCLAYASASQCCVPWDKVKPRNNNSNIEEPQREPGVVYLEV
ncbi:PREDICTED: uncharacterized protein LOC109164103 isoform X2 [Ipomoea nil]|nr:PREDICTED: uncharacterized protein LOC109164103 isoform X2 [Ipomoea nil]